MNETVLALIIYISWMLVLLMILLFVRVRKLLSGVHKSSSFKPDGSDVSDFAIRLCRVHANAYESFPIFAGLMLLFIALGQTSISNDTAYYLIAARILQSLIHMISVSNNAVRLRFFFFFVQCVIAVYWIVKLLQINL